MLIVYPTYCIAVEVPSLVLPRNTLDLFDPLLIDPTKNNILGINEIPALLRQHTSLLKCPFVAI